MPAVVLTGARQTGKTTLVRHLSATQGRAFATLDSLTTLDQARKSPETLVASPGPLTLDEVQRAPDLLLAVKHAIDEERVPGRFLLTGSANLLLMDKVGESLAGRAAFMVLRPMTEREKRGDAGDPPWSALCRARNADAALEALGPERKLDWKDSALRGGFPPSALADDPQDRAVWFEAYVETYVQRDLRDLAQVGDLGAFVRLMRLVALRNGALSNVTDLARDAEVPRTTAVRWISLLETSFLVTSLSAFATSRRRRLVQTPKLYAVDSGLGLHLAGVENAEALSADARAGSWLETLILNDLLAWRDLEVRKPQLHHWRDTNGLEIDFVVERGRRLLPIEVKASAGLRTANARAIEAFCEEHGDAAPFGLLLHGGAEAVRLMPRTLAVPFARLL